MTGRGVDQILPHPCKPNLYEPYVRSALDYVQLAENWVAMWRIWRALNSSCAAQANQRPEIPEEGLLRHSHSACLRGTLECGLKIKPD
ncbi:MAG TPA: hypothetical protein VFW43_00615, partial [Polaromonas sp.]|nr:hypothetical protein [Polaromonas sp.]